MQFSSLIFYLIAGIIVVFALLTVLSKNLVHSALHMVAAFIGIAALYALLMADYLAVVQVLIYVGAVSIIIVFGIMLTRRESMDQSNMPNQNRWWGLIFSVLFFIVLARSILLTAFVPGTGQAQETTINQIADLLLGNYAIPFELTGVILLVAMIGAIILGKSARSTK